MAKIRMNPWILVLGTGLAFGFPFYFSYVFEKRTKIDHEAPYNPALVRRGAFGNSGSVDIGPDKDWENGKWKLKSVKDNPLNPDVNIPWQEFKKQHMEKDQE